MANRDRLADRRQPSRNRTAAHQGRLPTVALPGWDVHAVDGSGNDVPVGDEGAIVIKLPMPPGALQTLWNDDDRFRSSYTAAFDGYYLTGDGGRIDADGYIWVLGRTDDVINVAATACPPAAWRK